MIKTKGINMFDKSFFELSALSLKVKVLTFKLA